MKKQKTKKLCLESITTLCFKRQKKKISQYTQNFMHMMDVSHLSMPISNERD